MFCVVDPVVDEDVREDPTLAERGGEQRHPEVVGHRRRRRRPVPGVDEAAGDGDAAALERHDRAEAALGQHPGVRRRDRRTRRRPAGRSRGTTAATSLARARLRRRSASFSGRQASSWSAKKRRSPVQARLAVDEVLGIAEPVVARQHARRGTARGRRSRGRRRACGRTTRRRAPPARRGAGSGRPGSRASRAGSARRRTSPSRPRSARCATGPTAASAWRHPRRAPPGRRASGAVVSRGSGCPPRPSGRRPSCSAGPVAARPASSGSRAGS